MNILKSKLIKLSVCLLVVGIFVSAKTEVAKADVEIKGNTQVVLRTATFKTEKVIKVPARNTEKNKNGSNITLSRGEIAAPQGGGNLISYAYKFIGKPYVWGAEGPKSFDCSGFTKYVYQSVGINLPHYTGSQIGQGKSVSRGELAQGDLVFFNTDGSTVSHVGIYVGDGQFIHASSGSKKITVSDLGQSYYNSRYVGARRILK